MSRNKTNEEFLEEVNLLYPNKEYDTNNKNDTIYFIVYICLRFSYLLVL